MHHKLLLAHNW